MSSRVCSLITLLAIIVGQYALADRSETVAFVAGKMAEYYSVNGLPAFEAASRRENHEWVGLDQWHSTQAARATGLQLNGADQEIFIDAAAEFLHDHLSAVAQTHTIPMLALLCKTARDWSIPGSPEKFGDELLTRLLESGIQQAESPGRIGQLLECYYRDQTQKRDWDWYSVLDHALLDNPSRFGKTPAEAAQEITAQISSLGGASSKLAVILGEWRQQLREGIRTNYRESTSAAQLAPPSADVLSKPTRKNRMGIVCGLR